MAYEIAVLTSMSIAILFALSLNVITGFCGQVSLGHAAFYGMGAYTAALLTKAGYPSRWRSCPPPGWRERWGSSSAWRRCACATISSPSPPWG